MPESPPPEPTFPTSHPSLVSFDGSYLGSLTGWRATAGTAQFEEATNVTSTVVGEGLAARIVRSYDCTAVDPGSAEVTLFGCPPYSPADLGTHGVLYITFQGGTVSLNAYLENFEVTASVGQMLVGSARFRFSGHA